MKRLIAGLLLALSLTGCGGMKIDDFAGKQPALKIEEYFAGQTRAWGVFEDRFGTLRREFTVDITGAWKGDEFELDERFLYADGETDRRVWRLKRTGPDAWEGRTEDADGVALGREAGNAFNFGYYLNMKVGDGRWRVRFDDWMFLQPDGVLINRAYVYRWGIQIGSVTIVFRRSAS
jgi:hypothetical protein